MYAVTCSRSSTSVRPSVVSETIPRHCKFLDRDPQLLIIWYGHVYSERMTRRDALRALVATGVGLAHAAVSRTARAYERHRLDPRRSGSRTCPGCRRPSMGSASASSPTSTTAHRSRRGRDATPSRCSQAADPDLDRARRRLRHVRQSRLRRTGRRAARAAGRDAPRVLRRSRQSRRRQGHARRRWRAKGFTVLKDQRTTRTINGENDRFRGHPVLDAARVRRRARAQGHRHRRRSCSPTIPGA